MAGGDFPLRREGYLVFGAPRVPPEAISAVIDVLTSGWLGTGPKVAEFEKAFAAYAGTQYAVGLSSCTAALHLALKVLGVGPEDEVITTPLTFAATANVVMHVGARPVFADVEPDTGNLDPAAAAASVTPRTKAIILVHFAGRPCDMDRFLALSQRYGVFLIEDAAHALEAWYRGRKVGSIGHVAAFSFYPTKSLTTGEGGMLTTSNESWADRAKILRMHGLSRDAWQRYTESLFGDYEVLEPGFKYNMTDIQAALGLVQLKQLDRWLQHRTRLWQLYNEGLRDLPGLQIPPEEEHIIHARHLYTICVDPAEAPVDRSTLMRLLHEAGVGTGIHYRALHLHKFYREKFGYKRGFFPNAERISDQTLSLPLTSWMTENDVVYVIDVIRAVWSAGKIR